MSKRPYAQSLSQEWVSAHGGRQSTWVSAHDVEELHAYIDKLEKEIDRRKAAE